MNINRKDKEAEKIIQARTPNPGEGLFIHHWGGSRRTNRVSNTGKYDSGVWDVEVYKVQHNRHMNWAMETFLIV